MSGTMGGSPSDPAQASSPGTSVREVQGHFHNDESMQAALSALTDAGYDRTDFSLPEDQASSVSGTPNDDGQEASTDVADKAQLRTLGTSMAGYIGAVAVAGATIATGGAAGLAVGAAAAVGGGGALAAEAVGKAADEAQMQARDEKGAAGQLILAVRTQSPDQADQVTKIMQQAGATGVTPIDRPDQALTAGYSAASWTGG